MGVRGKKRWNPGELTPLIQSRINDFITHITPALQEVSTETEPLHTFARDLLYGGKKFRSQFCVLGWLAVSPESEHGELSDAVLAVAASLEIFHAAALVHDDIIDNSDTRRGLPSIHQRFAELHPHTNFRPSSQPSSALPSHRTTNDDFGKAAAILLGDLLLGWSDELFNNGLALLPNPLMTRPTQHQFTLMRTQVAAGQYLDILEEKAWATHDEDQLLARAERIVTYKSAKYSVEAPLLIGATMNGATQEQLNSLQSFGLPLGTAFQLRDDLLGVFGDPRVTGKPAGDDLREGKRTILIALTRKRVSLQERQDIDNALGDRSLTEQDIHRLQAIIHNSGSVEEVENRIDTDVQRALQHLKFSTLNRDATERLRHMAVSATARSA